MGHHEERVGLLRPRAKRRCNRTELFRRRQPVGDGLVTERRVFAAVSPQVTPPGAGLWVGVGPRGAGRLDIEKAGVERPSLEKASGIGLASVAARDRAV